MTLNTPRSRAESARRIYQSSLLNGGPAADSLVLWFFDEQLYEDDNQPPEHRLGRSTQLGGALLDLIRRSRDSWLTDVVVFSDGRIHDRAALARAVMLARRAGIPVSVCPVGRETRFANLAIGNCMVERHTTPDTRLPVAAYIRAEGVRGQRCELLLQGPQGEEIARVPFTAEEGVRRTELYVDVGHEGGTYTLSLSELPGEISYEDNRYEFDVEVKARTLRVLYMEGTVRTNEAWEYEEYEFLARALEETGEIEVDVLLIDEQKPVGGNLFRVGDPSRGYPETREELFEYDVVICSDINRHIFSPEQMQWTVELVAERGGGFVMIGGYTSFNAGGYDMTVWERMIPVDMEEVRRGYDNTGFIPSVPPEAYNHPILQLEPDQDANAAALEAMPPFMGTNLVRREKPAATVLVEHPDLGIPTICVQRYGRGRAMAFLSDTTSGWGRLFETSWGVNAVLGQTQPVDLSPGHEPPSGPAPADGGDNTYFKRFWINAIRWLAKNSLAHREARILVNTDRVTYRPGEQITVRVTFLDTGDQPLEAFLPSARLGVPGHRQVPLTFDETSGEYAATLTVPVDTEAKQLAIHVHAGTGQEEFTDQTTVLVLHRGREFREPQPDHAFLEELARATGGHVVRTANDVRELLEQRRENMPEPLTFRVPHWDQAWLWLLVLLLLTGEWVVRRRA